MISNKYIGPALATEVKVQWRIQTGLTGLAKPLKDSRPYIFSSLTRHVNMRKPSSLTVTQKTGQHVRNMVTIIIFV